MKKLRQCHTMYITAFIGRLLFVLSVCVSVTLAYCGQTVGWINMSLGTEVGLGPGDIVLDGDTAPH